MWDFDRLIGGNCLTVRKKANVIHLRVAVGSPSMGDLRSMDCRRSRRARSHDQIYS